MSELFVLYELAKRVKEKGFNGNCLGFFDDEGNFYFNDGLEDGASENDYSVNSELVFPYIAAPLYQQVTDWLRREKNIHIQISNGLIGYQWHLNKVNENGNLKHNNSFPVLAYYEALTKAIEEALKLI